MLVYKASRLTSRPSICKNRPGSIQLVYNDCLVDGHYNSRRALSPYYSKTVVKIPCDISLVRFTDISRLGLLERQNLSLELCVYTVRCSLECSAGGWSLSVVSK